MPRTAPYGTWESPITADLIVAGAISLRQVQLAGDTVVWQERRPQEGGRATVMRWSLAGGTTELTPAPFVVRTRVHEYGGGAFRAVGDTLYACNDADRRVYRCPPGAEPVPITPAGPFRYADLHVFGDRLVAVREDHSGRGEAVNTLVSLDPHGGGPGEVVASGHDFYASPASGPDGTLAYLRWDHPRLPWDGTELVRRAANGRETVLAGGPDESVFQPRWGPDGTLYFVSDATGWWNLYAWRDGTVRPLCPRAAEFGLPQWVFGMSTYAVLDADRLLCAWTRDGLWSLGILAAGQLTPLELPYSRISQVRGHGNTAVFFGAGPSIPAELVRLDLATGARTVLRRSLELDLDADRISAPEAIDFPSTGGRQAHAFHYPPRNPDFVAPAAEKPPLIVQIHGGPTAATEAAFSLDIQFWTSRGFAVVDVNYAGSTGYGRPYRQALYGQWGIADVDDCVAAAEYLVARGAVDGARLAITGGSAGGFTTLAALAFRDVFAAGASHFGVSDCEALARDTHKFEKHYLDQLIGPYPEARDTYRARSPVHHCDRLSCPVVFFQGDEDPIVPPNQAEMMVAALRAKGVPVAYVLFPGEQHGFRQAAHVKRALEGELYFYARIFHFTPADDLDPLPIANLVPWL